MGPHRNGKQKCISKNGALYSVCNIPMRLLCIKKQQKEAVRLNVKSRFWHPHCSGETKIRSASPSRRRNLGKYQRSHIKRPALSDSRKSACALPACWKKVNSFLKQHYPQPLKWATSNSGKGSWQQNIGCVVSSFSFSPKLEVSQMLNQ